MWTSALTFTLAAWWRSLCHWDLSRLADSESIIPTLQGCLWTAFWGCIWLFHLANRRCLENWILVRWECYLHSGLMTLDWYWLWFCGVTGGNFSGLPVASGYLVQSGPNFLFHLPISVYERSNEKPNLYNCISVNHLLTCVQPNTKDKWKPCLQIFTYFYADMYLTSYMMDKIDIETNKEPVRHRE